MSAKVFQWIWVMFRFFNDGSDGYVLGQSMMHYTNRGECAKAAKEWLKNTNVEQCVLCRGPYLIIETLDGEKNTY